MTRFFSRGRSLTAAAALLLLPGAFAQTFPMNAVLDGPQDGTTATAIGSASAVVDTAANTVTFTLQFSGLSSTQTAAHIHGPANPGANGGVQFSIGVGSPINGVWNYPQSMEADILGGRTYFNVHTQNLPGGEIRGQLTRTPINYCSCGAGSGPCGNDDASAGCANSTGSGASIQSGGMASVALDTLSLSATGLPANQNGIFYMGPNQIAAPFGDGQRCVGGTVFRYPVQNAGSAGTLTLGPGIAAYSVAHFPLSGQITSGSSWNFQCWHRDPGGPCGAGYNLSDAVSVSFTP